MNLRKLIWTGVLLTPLVGCGPSAGETSSASTEAAPKEVASQPTTEGEKTPASVPTPVVKSPEANHPAIPGAGAPAAKVAQTPSTPTEPFRYPSDVGGKQVARALAPGLPSAPVLPPTSTPRPRSSSLDRGELPLPKASTELPRTPMVTSGKPIARPTPPPERVPLDLGQGAAINPASIPLTERPKLKAPSPPAPGAADLPPLARPMTERASLEDPTAEFTAVRVIRTPLPLPEVAGWFIRFTIPDPFELVEQLKGKTGTDAELGVTPAVVPPLKK